MWLLSLCPVNVDRVLTGARIFARGDVFPVFSVLIARTLAIFSICRVIFLFSTQELCFIPPRFWYPAAFCLSLGGGISLHKSSTKLVFREGAALVYFMENTLTALDKAVAFSPWVLWFAVMPRSTSPWRCGHLAYRHSCFLCFLSLLGVKLRTKLHGKLHKLWPETHAFHWAASLSS